MRITLLDQSIFFSVLKAMLGVILVICAIDLLFGLLDLVGDIGDDFSFTDALLSVLLNLPSRCIEFASVASLIGALLALGIKASSAELVVMRAAGWSKVRILIPAIAASLLISGVSIGLAQFVVPNVKEHQAQLGQSKIKGVWLRDGQTYVKVRQVLPDGKLKGVTLIDLSAHTLLGVKYAMEASFDTASNSWVLAEVSSTELTPEGVLATQQPAFIWQPKAGPKEFLSIARPPEALSVSGQYDFIQYRRDQGLDVRRYELSLFKTLLQPLANGVMVFLASSLVFGSMRMVSMGYRLTLGLMFGLGFFYAQDLFGFLSLVYGWHPLITLLTPVFGFGMLAWSKFQK